MPFTHRLWIALALAAASVQPLLAAEPGILFDATTGTQVLKIKPSHDTVSATERAAGIGQIIDVAVAPTGKGFPGVSLKPAEGESWDLAAFGHLTARVINTGDRPIRLGFRVDGNGDWRESPWNAEGTRIRPGEAGNIKVIFGYAHGYKPSYQLDASAVKQLLIFTGKTKTPVSFQIESIIPGGEPGETPSVNPRDVRIRPKGGKLLDQGVDPSRMPKVKGQGVQTTLGADGLSVAIAAGASKPAITLTPPMGRWDLSRSNALRVTMTNTGDAPIAPRLMIKSDGGKTRVVEADAPIAPGKTASLILHFAPEQVWVGADEITRKHNPGKPGTGSSFRSNVASAVEIAFDAADAERALRVDSVAAEVIADDVPDWLGTRPPVEGDWTLTLNEDFDSDALDRSLWNIYNANFWDTRTHFSKDNIVLEDGAIKLRYEKKRGYVNDDPTQKLPKTGKNESPYASGFLSTYGNWVQRYGYFEARMKLPTASGLWPAFWMMPDRGEDKGPQWVRASTKDGGMEFDIMEHLTRWGPYRYNVALHWDGYKDEHKATGTSNIYVGPDADGYITTGLLWLPGQVVFYCNGVEVGRWDNDRVSNVPSYPILYMVSGGWDNSAIDDKQLPADFVVDYVRIWQRADLASDVDGPQE